MKVVLLICLVMLISVSGVLAGEDEELGLRPDLTSTPAKFFFNGKEETGLNSPLMFGVVYDIGVKGSIWTPGIYFFTEIDTGDDDGDVKFGLAFNVKTPFFKLGAGVFWQFYESGNGNGGLAGFNGDTAGFLVSYNIGK